MRSLLATLCVLWVSGCGGGDGGGGSDGGTELASKRCPGVGCEDTGDGVLYVGAAAEKITPVLTETEWTDTNGDKHWTAGEPFVDVNGNGKFDAYWLAGFDAGRVATSVHDDLWVRVIALRYNQTTITFASIDAVGYFKDEMDLIRASLPASLGVDLAVFSATHDHEAPDTAGIWGQNNVKSGINPPWMAIIRAQALKAITAAVNGARPANLTIAQIPVEDGPKDFWNWQHDSRDPVIVDNTMTVIRFNEAGAPQSTIATWVTWTSHPEYAWATNNAITSDFPHKLRETVETALGGVCMFTNGPLGGLIYPGSPSGGIPIKRSDGSVITEDTPERGDVAGAALGAWALRALEAGRGAETLMTAKLAFKTQELYAEVDNYKYHAAGILKLFDRKQYRYDPDKPISRSSGNIPSVKMEVTHVEVGPIGFAALPGEIFTELWLGGYDGSHTPAGQPIVDPDNPNKPDLTMAPPGPYIRDLLLARPGITYAVGLGLTQDWVGYIMPRYDFKVHDDGPYYQEPEGDHYEETNSIGPLAEEQVIGPLRALIQAP